MTSPTALNHVTTPYGEKGDWVAGYHTGVDYRAPAGTEIFATKGGKVMHAGTGGYGPAYGVHVIIQSYYWGVRRRHLYAHLSKSDVQVGEKVKAGQVIGLSGETGNTFGAHLHYEERRYPFGYWNHYRPVFPDWQPFKKRYLNKKV